MKNFSIVTPKRKTFLATERLLKQSGTRKSVRVTQMFGFANFLRTSHVNRRLTQFTYRTGHVNTYF